MERRLWIGDWQVDPGTNELCRGTTAVRVEPKAMDVLMLLAGQVGRVVRREELFAAVWPGVVVGDEALTQSVIKLRRALGDDPRSPAYIETISKRGYRLIARVAPAEGSEPASDPQVALEPDARSITPRRVPAAWGVTAIVAAAAVIGLYSSGWLTTPATKVGDPEAQAGSAGPVTVAVVPFDVIGPGGNQAYLARGISDDLATALSGLSELRLIRASTGITATSDGGARYSVSGSVQRDGDGLRVRVSLVDVVTGEQVWAGRYERPYGDLFAVQDEITASLVGLLPAKVSVAERQRLAKRYTRNLDAYDAFLRGQASFLVRRSEDNEAARALYRKAIELDPRFARAYASLAMTYAMDYRLRPHEAPGALDRALDIAETARLIDPELPEVYWALGFIHAQARRHDQAITALQQAIRLDRSFADAYALLGGIETYVGRPVESIPLLRAAMRLNPESGYLYFLLLGRAYLFENDTEQALINLREAALRNPVDVETRVFLAAAFAAVGDARAARWEADEIRALEPGFSTAAWLDSYPMTVASQRDRLTTLLANTSL